MLFKSRQLKLVLRQDTIDLRMDVSKRSGETPASSGFVRNDMNCPYVFGLTFLKWALAPAYSTFLFRQPLA